MRVALVAPSETMALGRSVARILCPSDVVLLIGELGSGKTTLTTGLVRALGANGPVTSPTFTLVQHYEGTLAVTHVDCWRLSDPLQVGDLGLEEVLDEGGVCVVEWGELARDWLGDDVLVVTLEYADAGAGPTPAHETGRIAWIDSASPRFSSRTASLRSALLSEGLRVADLEGAPAPGCDRRTDRC